MRKSAPRTMVGMSQFRSPVRSPRLIALMPSCMVTLDTRSSTVLMVGSPMPRIGDEPGGDADHEDHAADHEERRTHEHAEREEHHAETKYRRRDARLWDVDGVIVAMVRGHAVRRLPPRLACVEVSS